MSKFETCSIIYSQCKQVPDSYRYPGIKSPKVQAGSEWFSERKVDAKRNLKQFSQISNNFIKFKNFLPDM